MVFGENNFSNHVNCNIVVTTNKKIDKIAAERQMRR